VRYIHNIMLARWYVWERRGVGMARHTHLYCS